MRRAPFQPSGLHAGRRSQARGVVARNPCSPAVQSGYILLATLATLVIMVLLVSAIAGSVQLGVQDSRDDDRALQASIDMQSTQATVLYLLATQRHTAAGLTIDDPPKPRIENDLASFDDPSRFAVVGNELRLDGRSYAGFGEVVFSLQDDASAPSVEGGEPWIIQGALAQLGAEDAQAVGLIAKLRDYVDADSLHRLDGGEGAAYREAGLPPPANRPLVTPLELRQVLGWRELLDDINDDEVLRLFTVGAPPLLNFNTASEIYLRCLPGIDAPIAQRILAIRAVQPFTHLPALYQITGFIQEDEERFAVFSAGSGLLRMWSSAGGPMQVMHWTLTPNADGAQPWRKMFALAIPSPEAVDGVRIEKPGAEVFADALSAHR